MRRHGLQYSLTREEDPGHCQPGHLASSLLPLLLMLLLTHFFMTEGMSSNVWPFSAISSQTKKHWRHVDTARLKTFMKSFDTT
mmetsp:Transcript_6102/g.14177  ORF Transcript_6102/g.14177 Transcript_6102/m.14177 type:complete len:83 (+) Transcript_6102:265-513(+)